jgi:hypothetical protein
MQDFEGGVVRFREDDEELEESLKGIHRKLDDILKLFKLQRTGDLETMATLKDILAVTTSEKTQIGSLAVLTSGIKKQLDDVLAGVDLPPTVQAQIDEVFAAVTSNSADVVTAINANTAAAAVPVVPPAAA